MISSFLNVLLKNRGLEKTSEIEKFLYPKWEDNFDPFLFLDMKKVVKRIWQAVEENEKILIFSDYDTDGIPGGALLSDFFKKIKYKNFENLIPNRNYDGYGLSKKMAEKIVTEIKPTLVITVDCGITDVEGAQILNSRNKASSKSLLLKKQKEEGKGEAKKEEKKKEERKRGGEGEKKQEKKIDLIITDHHLPNGKLPEAFAILDHKVPTEKYPEQVLCGAGIAFKLVQALISKKGLEIKNKLEIKNCKLKIENKLKINQGWEKWLLDLVAISTVCDMVPLTGENRILVKYGKIVLDKTPRFGLRKIIEKARLDQKNIKTDDIGFMIGPRLNSASRLEDPRIAFIALAGEKEEAISSAEELEKLNNRRKYLLAKIMKEVWKKLKSRNEFKVIVIGNKDWPLGMLGLIAGKIADKYQRPTFVWSESKLKQVNNKTSQDIVEVKDKKKIPSTILSDQQILKGSCRSGSKYAVFSLMEKTASEFIKFGGHAKSGGFEIAFDKIHSLEEKLSQNIEKTEIILEKEVKTEAEISLDEVNMNNYRDIEKLEPFGMSNPKPTFLIKNIEIYEIKFFGKSKEHLELVFKNSQNFRIKAITFYYQDKFEEIFTVGQKINLICSFELNAWNGNSNLRLSINKILKN